MNCGGNAAEKILRNCQAEKMIVQSFFCCTILAS